MSLVINLKKYSIKDIYWPLIILFMIKQLTILSAKQMFVLYGIIFVMIVSAAKKIIIPHIYGLYFYCGVIVFELITGAVLYEFRDLIRDIYYIVPTIIVIVLGYYFKLLDKNKSSILKTVVVCGGIASMINFVRAFLEPASFHDGEKLREMFDSGSYEIIVAFLVVSIAIFTKIDIKLFSKKINLLIWGILFVNIILSLARSVWIEAIVGIILAVVLEGIVSNNMVRLVKKIFIVSMLFITTFVIFLAVAPKSAVNTMLFKLENSSQELDSTQNFSNTTEAMHNWRGYENQSAKTQWKNSNLYVKIWGYGIGKGTYVKYVPYTWKGMIKNNEVPLLHNGYYTILTKGGIVGVCALIWFMLSNILIGMKLLKKRKDIQEELIVLICIEILFMVQTYVVRGPISQSVNLLTAILVGWINSDIYTGKRESIMCEEKIEEENI